MMRNVLAVLAFIAIGALIGFLFKRFLYENASLAVSIILGIVGSVGFSWGGNLLGLGGGLFTFSVWGIVLAIVGACLLAWVYGMINKKRSQYA